MPPPPLNEPRRPCPPGYWKNHEAATTALLPQTLGGYTVATFADAQAIFDAMKCNAPANCLAGHLLAAELDVASGSATCIGPTIADANLFLSSIGYAGVGTYTLTSAQAGTALSYEATLDSYTNDSTSATCETPAPSFGRAGVYLGSPSASHDA
jgi:hypothetical protein